LSETGDQLTVEISKNGNQYLVSVCDNGSGLPKEFNIEKSANLGLQIANTLTKNELNGSINLVRVENLTRGDISFKVN
jgi:two-component sensor histidine kinase